MATTFTIEQLFLLAFMIEALVESVLWVFENGWKTPRLMSLGFSVVFCMGMGFDMFRLVGLSFGYGLWGLYIGAFFTGVLVSRGSNYMHDLFSILKGTARLFTVPKTGP